MGRRREGSLASSLLLLRSRDCCPFERGFKIANVENYGVGFSARGAFWFSNGRRIRGSWAGVGTAWGRHASWMSRSSGRYGFCSFLFFLSAEGCGAGICDECFDWILFDGWGADWMRCDAMPVLLCSVAATLRIIFLNLGLPARVEPGRGWIARVFRQPRTPRTGRAWLSLIFPALDSPDGLSWVGGGLDGSRFSMMYVCSGRQPLP